jgi:hypothetical protein
VALLQEHEQRRFVLAQEGQHFFSDSTLWRIVAQLIPINGELDVTRLEIVEYLDCCHKEAPC